MVRRPIKQEPPSWVRPLCGASERRRPQSAGWRGQPDLLEAVGTPKPGPHRPQGGARLPARTSVPLGSTAGDRSPKLCPKRWPWPRGWRPPAPAGSVTPRHTLPCRASPEASCVPSGRARPSSGPAVQSGRSPHTVTPRVTPQTGGLPQSRPEPSCAECGVGRPSHPPRLMGPGERGASGGPRGTAGSSPSTESGRLPQAASERGCACAAHLTAPEAAGLRPGLGWGGGRRAAQRARARGPPGRRPTAGSRGASRAPSTDGAVNGLWKAASGSPRAHRAVPAPHGKAGRRTDPPASKKGQRGRRRPPSRLLEATGTAFHFPTSRDPRRDPLAHFGCEGKSSVLGWGALRCPPPRH